MKMLRFLSPLACMAFMLAAAAPLAHADVMGTVYINQAPYNGMPLANPPYSGTNASFSVSAIDFNSHGSTDYTIGSFLTSDGATVTPGANYSALAGGGLNNTIFDFKGNTYLAAGTYTVTHDDGAYLFLNGGSNVLTPYNSGTPTSAEDSFFTIATGGTYGFELAYTEVNGAPAVLDAPFASTPEPSSFILLGSGLIAAAGMVRRRMAA